MSGAAGHSRAPLMSRTDITGLLAMMAHHRGYVPGESDVYWWREQLAGYTAPQCQAAIWTLSQGGTRITPSAIIAQINGARPVTPASSRATPTPPPFPRRDRSTDDRSAHAEAARRGISAIYDLTGWRRNPDQAAALSVPCPIHRCGADVGVICADVSQPEPRHRTTRVHPSRVQAGRDAAEAEQRQEETT